MPTPPLPFAIIRDKSKDYRSFDIICRKCWKVCAAWDWEGNARVAAVTHINTEHPQSVELLPIQYRAQFKPLLGLWHYVEDYPGLTPARREYLKGQVDAEIRAKALRRP